MTKNIQNIIYLIIFLILIINSYIFINKNNKLKEELNNNQIQYNNTVVLAESLKIVEKNLYSRLSYLNNSDSLLKIEKEQLNKKLKGSTQQIINLEFKIKQISENNIFSKPDTVFINDINNSSLFQYNYLKNYPNYSTNGKIGIYSTIKPDSISVSLNTIFNPIEINIYTKKLETYKYEILVKTNSDIFVLTNATSYISIDKPKVSFFSRFNAGLGIGILNDGYAFISGNLKYYNHNFGLIYSGNNGRFGGQYIYYIR